MEKPKMDDLPAVLEVPIQFMRVVWAWPDEGRNAFQVFVSRYVYSGAFWALFFGGISFLLSREYDNFMPALSAVGDTMAGFVCICKIRCVHKNGNELVALRDALENAFFDVETRLAPGEARAANAHCLARARTVSRRFLWLYVPLSASGLLTNILSAVTDDRVTRRLNINLPAVITQTDWTYWPMLVATLVVLSSFLFYSGGYDTIFLSLCLHLSCKCEILRVLLRRVGQLADESEDVHARQPEFEYWNDDGSAFERDRTMAWPTSRVEAALKDCVQYHQLIIKSRDSTEKVFSGVSLIQMTYILMGLGIPALRALYGESIDLTSAIFLLFYAAWNFSQLLFYCWFADALAHSSHEVSVAAYAALRPDAPLLDGDEKGLELRRHVCNLSQQRTATIHEHSRHAKLQSGRNASSKYGSRSDVEA